MADVVYLIQDMLFTSKVREAAKPAALRCRPRATRRRFVAAARGAKLVIVDLRLPAALEALEALQALRPRPRPSASSTTSAPTSWTPRAPRARR